jgi:hypothetical protein
MKSNPELLGQFILLDQNSGRKQKNWLEKFVLRENATLICLETNVGIAKAWERLLSQANQDFVLLLENDWFCSTPNAKFLQSALGILERHPEVGFVKLRSLRDKDDWGRDALDHSPWNFPIHEGSLFTRHREDVEYFIVPSSGTSFTLNPILARRTFIEEIRRYFIDNPESSTPLRSGEDGPNMAWRGQTHWKAAVLSKGPFRHTGFYRKRDQVFTLAVYKALHASRVFARRIFS